MFLGYGDRVVLTGRRVKPLGFQIGLEGFQIGFQWPGEVIRKMIEELKTISDHKEL